MFLGRPSEKQCATHPRSFDWMFVPCAFVPAAYPLPFLGYCKCHPIEAIKALNPAMIGCESCRRSLLMLGVDGPHLPSADAHDASHLASTAPVVQAGAG